MPASAKPRKKLENCLDGKNSHMKNQDEKIHFILTGGTIDSSTKGQERDVLLERSTVPEYLKSLKLYQQLNFTTLCWKDSRDLKDKDREEILQAIEQSDSKKFIITHGTFTVAETGKFLKTNLQDQNKTIVLTSSFTPLIGFENSDAPFNLGFALAKAEELQPGVYICMNGRVFAPEEAAKDTSQGRFYSILNS